MTVNEFDPYEPPAAARRAQAVSDSPPLSPAEVEQMIVHLKATRPWVLFLAVLGFVVAGVVVLVSLVMLLVAALDAPADKGAVVALVVIGSFYLFYAGFQVAYGVLLVRYARAITRAVHTREPQDVARALAKQKTFWKGMGVTAIAVVCLTVLGFLAAFAAGVVTALGKS